ncbi:hypothetical protein [Streptomyces antimicrobicus]|uniref:Uncharacterized protein n=1 Tax=Streptomyces antimicrobicus TaxID=2883108 RepID=A0ABS8B2W6_9ACTN|nr:hypothetical protein [Streptomyces antimicrobicus]MCB5178926.1 hypothetical protein [Streptomyces antimicrobicus]
MSARWESLKNRATLCLLLVAVAAGVFFVVGSASQQPSGWGAAYAFGSPARLQLPARCGTETVSGGRGTVVCERTTWTVDGETHQGALYAYADQIERSSGSLTLKGEAHVLADRAYGEPESWLTFVHLGALTLAATGLLGLLGSVVVALLPGRR